MEHRRNARIGAGACLKIRKAGLVFGCWENHEPKRRGRRDKGRKRKRKKKKLTLIFLIFKWVQIDTRR